MFASSPRKKYGVIKVRIPEDELENLNRRVARSGVSREEFVRRVLAGAVIMETPPADYRLVLRDSGCAGNGHTGKSADG